MTIEQIQALLEKKFAGERKDGLRMLARTIAMTAADTEEETIKANIEALTADAVKDFIKEWRKEADAEITKSNQTAEENLAKYSGMLIGLDKVLGMLGVKLGSIADLAADAAALNDVYADVQKTTAYG